MIRFVAGLLIAATLAFGPAPAAAQGFVDSVEAMIRAAHGRTVAPSWSSTP